MTTDLQDSVLSKLQQQKKSVKPKTDKIREHLAFLIDVSGSMEERQKDGIIKLQQLQNALILFYRRNDGAQLHLITFSTIGRLYVGPFVDSVMSLQSYGGTYLSEGLKSSLELLGPYSNPRRIILLTDGNITENESEVWVYVNALAAAAIIVDCIGSGADANEKLLKNIAETCSGTYQHVDNLGDLSSKLLNITTDHYFPK